MNEHTLFTRTIIIGIFSLLHMVLAAPAVAFMVLAPLAETVGIRRPFFTDEARTMTRFTVATFAASSVLAVFMIELFVGLFPLTNTWLFNQFRLPIYLGTAAFLLMTFSLSAYFFWWDALRMKSVRLHIAIGTIAAVCVLVWAAILDGMGSYMLTPRQAAGTWATLLNPTWLPLMLHRFGGDLTVAGYLMAGYAAWMIGRRRDHHDELYYIHFFKAGFAIGLSGLLLQPLTGLLYATMIERAVPRAYEQLVFGRYQMLLYVQFALVAFLFIGSNWIVLAGVPTATFGLLRNGLVVVSAVLMVALVGQPDVRRLFTWLLVALTLWPLFAWRHSLLMAGSHEVNRLGIRLIASALAIVSLLTYLTMGVVRETARRPDTVHGIMPLHDEVEGQAAFR